MAEGQFQRLAVLASRADGPNGAPANQQYAFMRPSISGDGRFVEVQGTAESEPFDQPALDGLLVLAGQGIERLIARQREIVGSILGR